MDPPAGWRPDRAHDRVPDATGYSFCIDDQDPDLVKVINKETFEQVCINLCPSDPEFELYTHDSGDSYVYVRGMPVWHCLL